MKEEMIEEIMEYTDGIETEEEIYELCDEMESRWRYRKIEYRIIEDAIEEFKKEFFETFKEEFGIA